MSILVNMSTSTKITDFPWDFCRTYIKFIVRSEKIPEEVDRHFGLFVWQIE